MTLVFGRGARVPAKKHRKLGVLKLGEGTIRNEGQKGEGWMWMLKGEYSSPTTRVTKEVIS